ncbi:uncharacterized protein LOC128994679 isoform X4 [Macrosteles quadrilineatus]|uniref:uncharacterized protein LOC128994679 isoform X4 n=1 Tax=Macrosteles quadrilineatus TaxID=74068 RepID=UPI0023E2E2AC|nr:uncharacterized protein LOC128994679 isoform X4 [Macrosteles quadrilineatus]
MAVVLNDAYFEWLDRTPEEKRKYFFGRIVEQLERLNIGQKLAEKAHGQLSRSKPVVVLKRLGPELLEKKHGSREDKQFQHESKLEESGSKEKYRKHKPELLEKKHGSREDKQFPTHESKLEKSGSKEKYRKHKSKLEKSGSKEKYRKHKPELLEKKHGSREDKQFPTHESKLEKSGSKEKYRKHKSNVEEKIMQDKTEEDNIRHKEYISKEVENMQEKTIECNTVVNNLSSSNTILQESGRKISRENNKQDLGLTENTGELSEDKIVVKPKQELDIKSPSVKLVPNMSESKHVELNMEDEEVSHKLVDEKESVVAYQQEITFTPNQIDVPPVAKATSCFKKNWKNNGKVQKAHFDPNKFLNKKIQILIKKGLFDSKIQFLLNYLKSYYSLDYDNIEESANMNPVPIRPQSIASMVTVPNTRLQYSQLGFNKNISTEVNDYYCSQKSVASMATVPNTRLPPYSLEVADKEDCASVSTVLNIKFSSTKSVASMATLPNTRLPPYPLEVADKEDCASVSTVLNYSSGNTVASMATVPNTRLPPCSRVVADKEDCASVSTVLNYSSGNTVASMATVPNTRLPPCSRVVADKEDNASVSTVLNYSSGNAVASMATVPNTRLPLYSPVVASMTTVTNESQYSCKNNFKPPYPRQMFRPRNVERSQPSRFYNRGRDLRRSSYHHHARQKLSYPQRYK